jgi:glycosyltransferase involved in cell wall biosynthesis
MKRVKVAAWLSWAHWSEYYARQLGYALAPECEFTITYQPLDWAEFDKVFCFFPGPNRDPDCPREKIVKCVWEPHESAWATDARTVIACSTLVYDRLRSLYSNLQYIPFCVNKTHFCPQPFIAKPRTIGWAGNCRNPRKRFEELVWTVQDAGLIFHPSLFYLKSGRMVAQRTSEQMHRYYRGVHLYACASHGEGFHMPFIEAAACGRGIVTFDVGCARDLAAAGAGVVIVKDFREMETALVLADYVELGKKSARAIYGNFLWEHWRDAWLGVFCD